jgi:histidine triad (HIT) family protein
LKAEEKTVTIFTKIINREIPAQIVYEDEKCLAFRDVNPQAPVHVLLIPKKEIATMNDVHDSDRDLMGHLMVKVPEIARQLGIAESGYRTVINTNAQAGQTVFHIHIHIIGGRGLSWPPG